jgi:hypothetical protein
VTAGLPADIGTLNRTMGQAVVALAQALDTCAGINAMLYNTNRGFGLVNAGGGSYTSTALTAFGYSDDDINLIGAAFGALGLLQTIAYGTAAGVATDNNYFLQAQQLMGTVPL